MRREGKGGEASAWLCASLYGCRKAREQSDLPSTEDLGCSRDDLGKAFRGAQVSNFFGIDPSRFGELVAENGFAGDPTRREGQDDKMAHSAPSCVAFDEFAIACQPDRRDGQ